MHSPWRECDAKPISKLKNSKNQSPLPLYKWTFVRPIRSSFTQLLYEIDGCLITLALFLLAHVFEYEYSIDRLNVRIYVGQWVWHLQNLGEKISYSDFNVSNNVWTDIQRCVALNNITTQKQSTKSETTRERLIHSTSHKKNQCTISP